MSQMNVPIRQQVDDLPRYVPGRALEGAVKLSSNEMPQPPDQSIIDAASQALAQVNRYPDLTASELRGALAQRFGVDADEVCVGTGSSAILMAALMAVCCDGDEVVFPWRSFESYPIAVPAVHATARPVPLRESGQVDLHAMREALTERTRVVIVCTPNNPTGPALSFDEIHEFVRQVPPNILILMDEAYIDFADDPAIRSAIPLIGEFPNVLVMRTFSKVHALAGVRVGYAIGHRQLIGAIQAVLVPFGVSAVAQAAAVASLKGDEDVRAQARAIIGERHRMLEELRSLGFVVPDSQANFVMLMGEGEEFVAACAREGVVVRPFPEGIRVTVGTRELNDCVLRAAQSCAARRSDR
ncbi:histidinol-phosphate transaminase [Schaalia sp. ZJ1691]|uniref:histidinol-phosphate transaminase n=1 Tax=Schaalia sp. ZJ1691 TaxID=2709404 RepID=UPI0013ED7704|nr:histidinol-phosphate transaminase [Schaalia sp. ZJ1691]